MSTGRETPPPNLRGIIEIVPNARAVERGKAPALQEPNLKDQALGTRWTPPRHRRIYAFPGRDCS